MTRRILILAYALGAYTLALASLVYIMGFLANVGVPKGISDGPQRAAWLAALIDAGLVGLFGLHHSVTARTSFKRWWTKIIPPPIERATYLYMTVIMTALLVMIWQPIPITIWHVQSALPVAGICAAYLGVWSLMIAATFHFGHFGFFGLTQAWESFRNTPPRHTSMTARYLYALVRHPISLGWMIAPFIVPHLTLGHVVFAVATFVYIMLATPFEEADLIEEIGEPYINYQIRVRRFLPFPKSQSSVEHPEEDRS